MNIQQLSCILIACIFYGMVKAVIFNWQEGMPGYLSKAVIYPEKQNVFEGEKGFKVNTLSHGQVTMHFSRPNTSFQFYYPSQKTEILP